MFASLWASFCVNAGVSSVLAGALAGTGQAQLALNTCLEALRAAQVVGRDAVFRVLEQAVPALATIERGQALWRVYETVMEVEGWWGS